MECPNGHHYMVIDSRRRVYGAYVTVWRRRRCVGPECRHQIQTVEIPADMANDLFEDD